MYESCGSGFCCFSSNFAPIVIPVSAVALGVGIGIAAGAASIALFAGGYYLAREHFTIQATEITAKKNQDISAATMLMVEQESEIVENIQVKNKSLSYEEISAVVEKIKIHQGILEKTTDNLDERLAQDHLDVQIQLHHMKEQVSSYTADLEARVSHLEGFLTNGMFQPNLRQPLPAANDVHAETFPHRRGRPK